MMGGEKKAIDVGKISEGGGNEEQEEEQRDGALV